MSDTFNKIIYVFLEFPKYESDICIYTTAYYMPSIDILKNFQFRSDKSLNNLLEINKESILNGIPANEEDILTSLEVQNFLGYLNIKWYKECDNNKKIISSDEILDLALKYQIISEKDIMKYILENRNDYIYEIHKSSIKI